MPQSIANTLHNPAVKFAPLRYAGTALKRSPLPSRWASKTMRFLFALTFLFLQSVTAFAEPPSFPWKQGDPPPVIAGVKLGMSKETLLQLLGEPTQVQNLGEDSLALVFQPKGIMALWAPLDGVAIIYVQTRNAADIGGVRIGDSKSEVLARWGLPSSIQGPTAIYRAGSWGAVVRIDETDHVVQLSLGLLTP